jgi:molybdopterin molybdotransferase
MRLASAIEDLPPRFNCDAVKGVISVEEALQRVNECASPITGSETVVIREARGRILAADVVSTINVPPHDSAAMDGYAVYAADLAVKEETRMPIAGRAAAGHPLEEAAHPGAAVRVFTGAPMPTGPDTVVMQEQCVAEQGVVRISAGTRPGANIRRAGEDVVAGTKVLSRGQRLEPRHIALAAAVGCRELSVWRRLKVAVLSSGDELRAPGDPLSRGQVHDANRFALLTALEGLGCDTVDFGIVKDDACAVRSALAAAAHACDLVLSSGGMSDGEEDYFKCGVRALGSLNFWSLAVKPGRPVGMGRIGTTPFLGLPGNPVAALVTFLVLARPLVLRMAGATDIRPRALPVRAGFHHTKRAGRQEYLCARLTDNHDGKPVAQKLPRQGSHLLSSLAISDGFVVLEDERTAVEPGDAVALLPFGC